MLPVIWMQCVENSNLWEQCHGQDYVTTLTCQAWRVVEDQSHSSTRELVDTLEEHDILENLLEHNSKPSLPQEPEFLGLHFLLASPFRYPPLKYGSRFGRRYERSLWYGAQELETSFGESAFYRFLFFAGSMANLLPCYTYHSAYAIDIATSNGIMLTSDPFQTHQTLISQKDSYAYSQPLGTAMRQADIAGFTYFSARVASKINIGIFSPRAFAKKSVHALQHWQCYTDEQHVEFTQHHITTKIFLFTRDTFLVNATLPFDHTET